MTDSTSQATSPTDVDDFLRLGLRHFSRKNVDAANEAWNRVLELEPNHERATDYLTNTLVDVEDERDPAEAMQEAQSVINAYDDALGDVQELHQAIVELVKAGKLEEALVLLERAHDLVERGEEHFGRVRTLVENLLSLRYAVYLGPLDQVLAGEEDRAPTDLASEEMHVLALVDVNGREHQMSTLDLLDESLYGPFPTLRALITLCHRGLVTLHAPDAPPTPSDARHGDADASSAAAPPPPKPSDVEAPTDAAEATPDHAPGNLPTDQDEAASSPESAADDTPADSPPAGEDAAAEAGAGVAGDTDAEAVEAREGDAQTENAEPGPADGEARDGEDLGDDEYDELFRQGVSLYVQGEYDQARECFERCLAARPDDPRPKRNLQRLEKQS